MRYIFTLIACGLFTFSFAQTAAVTDSVTFKFTLNTPAEIIDSSYRYGIDDKTITINCGYAYMIETKTTHKGRTILQAEGGLLYTKEKPVGATAFYFGIPLSKGFDAGLRTTFANGLIMPVAVCSYSRVVYGKLSFSAFFGPGLAFAGRNNNFAVTSPRFNNNTETRSKAVFALDGGAKLHVLLSKRVSAYAGGGAMYSARNSVLPYTSVGVEIRTGKTKEIKRSYCRRICD